MACLRNACRITLRRALVLAGPPTLLVGALATAGGAAAAHFGEPSPAVLAPWLHVAAFAAAFGAGFAALATWPTYAQARPGADWVLRLRLGPLHGCAVAGLGALLALAVLLLPIGLVAAAVAPTPHAHRAATPLGQPLLDAERGEVQFAAAAGTYDELRLRPYAFAPDASPVPCTLEVRADDAPLTAAPLVVAGTRELLPLRFAPRPIRTLSIRRTAGNLPLLFAADSAVLVEAAPQSRLANGLCAAAWHLLPAGIGLLVALLLAPFASLSVQAIAYAALLLLQTLGSLGPAADAFTALLRGRWLGTEPLLLRSVPTLLAGLGALLAAIAVRRRLRR